MITEISHDFIEAIREILRTREHLEGDRAEDLIADLADQVLMYAGAWLPPTEITKFQRSRRKWLLELVKRAKALDRYCDMILFPGYEVEADARALRLQLGRMQANIRELKLRAGFLMEHYPAKQTRRADVPRAEMERVIAMRLCAAGIRPTCAPGGTLAAIFEVAYNELGISTDSADWAVRRACEWVP